MNTLPSVGASMQPRIDNSVVLPLPDGPINTVNLPPLTDRSMFLSARTCPAPGTLLTLRASIAGMIIVTLPSPDRCERRE